MSTRFAIFRIPVETNDFGQVISNYDSQDYVEIAFYNNQIYFTEPFDKADFALKDSVPVYPLDSIPQGIFTVGDIKKAIKKQLKGQKSVVHKPKRELHPSYMVWRSMWPKNDEFVDSKGVKHEKTRLFSCNDDKCERKFVSLLKQYSEEQLWHALTVEIEWRKNRTTKTGENQLKFMSGPEPYLNQRKFEAWIDQKPNETASTNKLVDPTDVF